MIGVGVGVTNRDYYGLMPTRKEYMDQVSKLCKRVKFLEREMQMLKSGKFEEEMSHSEKEEEDLLSNYMFLLIYVGYNSLSISIIKSSLSVSCS